MAKTHFFRCMKGPNSWADAGSSPDAEVNRSTHDGHTNHPSSTTPKERLPFVEVANGLILGQGPQLPVQSAIELILAPTPPAGGI